MCRLIAIGGCALGLAILLLLRPVGFPARAQEELCAEFESQQQAQEFLRANPGMADSLDPDADGVVCESLSPPGTTPPAASTPVAATAASSPRLPDALAARLGDRRAGFEAVYGAPAGGQDPDARFVRYVVPGITRTHVLYERDQFLLVRLRASQPPAAGEVAATSWSMEEAEDLVRRFLPADAVCRSRTPMEDTDGYFVTCRSGALVAAFDQADYDRYGVGGAPGDCRYAVRADQTGRVWGITVTIGNSVSSMIQPLATPIA